MTTEPESGSAGGGIPLHELIERSGILSPESALFVLRESLLGLAAAHDQGRHRPRRQGPAKARNREGHG